MVEVAIPAKNGTVLVNFNCIFPGTPECVNEGINENRSHYSGVIPITSTEAELK